ncbi:hypothetical protein GGR26_001711 [Lewinella marina]|uniref:hypothetical protein n=1 Tax=Neolewinella marina TaxID=438751 RepID=UPI0016AC14F0|nr:hypothetical protein [Neolewinella marina]NJB85943.1 hypothetical protein [Neolewinella marina]
MTRELKHVIVYGAFGLLLGTKIVEVLLTRSDTGIIDWWLLLIGLGAALVHYLPTRDNTPEEDDPPHQSTTPEDEDHDTLVLRDHPDPERGGQPQRHPAPAPRGARDPYL